MEILPPPDVTFNLRERGAWDRVSRAWREQKEREERWLSEMNRKWEAQLKRSNGL